MKTITLSLRNLLRNRRRSFATLMAVAIGTAAMLLFGGYRADITYGLQTAEVRRLGHIQIQRRDYFLYGSGDPTSFGIEDYERVIETVEHDPVLAPLVTAVAPLLQLGGLAGNSEAGVSRTIAAVGLSAVAFDRMQAWNGYGFRGKPEPSPLLNTPPDAAVIGTGLARALQLCTELEVPNCRAARDEGAASEGAGTPADIAALAAASSSPDADARSGASIEVLAATAKGAPNVARLSVARAKAQAVKELDDLYVEMHLGQAQQLVYGRDAPQVTAIAVQLARTADMGAAWGRLAALMHADLRGRDLELHAFQELSPTYGQTLALFGAIFGFISVLIAAIVLFMISNTTSMAVLERTAEIGTLRAMGLRRFGIVTLFLGEALFLAVFGVGVGVLVALAISAGINAGGVTWTPPGRVEPVPLSVRVWGELGLLATSALLLTVVTLISAWFPSRRAARTNIVDALRHA